eukprot:gene20912-22966_t
MLGEERKLQKIHLEAAETLVKCAFTAVKSKSAALHYESQVAFAFSVGAKVEAPEVYQRSSESGEVEGGSAEECTVQALGLVETKFGRQVQQFKVGASADGVYQARMFKEIVSTGKPEQAEFVGNVVWDPSHWLNLAVTDLKGGKRGLSKEFFANFVKRTNSFANALNRGIGSGILEATAKQLGVRATVAMTYFQTRFASSAYVQWTRLVKSHKLFISALKEASDAMSNDTHPLQYKVKGQDFVTDRLLMADTFEPIARKIVDKDPEDNNEEAHPTFQDIRLCVGWKIIYTTVTETRKPGAKRATKEVLIDWADSVMDTQWQYGGQGHSTLQERSLLDWATSNVIRSEEIIRQAAKLYVYGKKEEHLTKHRVET